MVDRLREGGRQLGILIPVGVGIGWPSTSKQLLKPSREVTVNVSQKSYRPSLLFERNPVKLFANAPATPDPSRSGVTDGMYDW
jgi:hypothetical protein